MAALAPDGGGREAGGFPQLPQRVPHVLHQGGDHSSLSFVRVAADCEFWGGALVWGRALAPEDEVARWFPNCAVGKVLILRAAGLGTRARGVRWREALSEKGQGKRGPEVGVWGWGSDTQEAHIGYSGERDGLPACSVAIEVGSAAVTPVPKRLRAGVDLLP
jgi:hypothetical protein